MAVVGRLQLALNDKTNRNGLRSGDIVIDKGADNSLKEGRSGGRKPQREKRGVVVEEKTCVELRRG